VTGVVDVRWRMADGGWGIVGDIGLFITIISFLFAAARGAQGVMTYREQRQLQQLNHYRLKAGRFLLRLKVAGHG
jgi:hypothetical protein